MKLAQALFAEDEHGNGVFLNVGDEITEIEDAGPEEVTELGRYGEAERVTGWNVTCRFTPVHRHWTEIVTVDAVKLLKALESRP